MAVTVEEMQQYFDGIKPQQQQQSELLQSILKGKHRAPDPMQYTGDAGLLARQARSIINSKGLWMDEEHLREQALRDLCEGAGVPYPESRWGFGPSALRLCKPDWWQKQIYKRQRRDWEAEQIAQGHVRKGRMLYCTDAAVITWRQRKARNLEMLQQVYAFNDDAFISDLASLAAGSVSNPEVRRAELFTRLRGLEEYSKAAGHVALFVTITCPSRMHPSSKKFDGTTPRQAQDYLSNTWAKIRAKLARLEVDYYGLRVAEPHHDGCPHWHVVLFCANRDRVSICRQVHKYARATDRAELVTDKAKKARSHIEHIVDSKGSVVAYVSKYIAKNIDGKRADGTSAGRAIDTQNGEEIDCGDTITSAERVTTWSSLWGIRQFQSFGGQRVGPWRELRRIHWQIRGNAMLEAARKAADAGDWAAYMKAAEQTEIEIWRHCEALELLREGDEKGAADALNQWQEPVFKTRGIRAPGVEIQTRRDDWQVMEEAAIHSAIHDAIFEPGEEFEFWMRLARNMEIAKPARAFLSFFKCFSGKRGSADPWTCVNNCTEGK